MPCCVFEQEDSALWWAVVGERGRHSGGSAAAGQKDSGDVVTSLGRMYTVPRMKRLASVLGVNDPWYWSVCETWRDERCHGRDETRFGDA